MTQAISDIAVRELSEDRSAALERLDFSLVEATVSEWAGGNAVKAMGAAGGFVVGAGTSENLVVGLAASAVGTFIGHLVGDATRQVVDDYRHIAITVAFGSLGNDSSPARCSGWPAAGYLAGGLAEAILKQAELR